MMESIPLEQEKSQMHWRDLGRWNYYFLLKFALLWGGYLNFHAFANLVFLAFLLFPVSSSFLRWCRDTVAIPIGFALLYHDTWLPGIYSIAAQGTGLFSFSFDYLVELLGRFINWQLIAMAFVLFVAYLFISQWIRITVFTIAGLCWLNIITLTGPAVAFFPTKKETAASSQGKTAEAVPSAGDETLDSDLPPTNENLNTYLNQFYAQQKGKEVIFPSVLPVDAQAFEIILVQICSMSWADIEAVHLDHHPMWGKFDILFDKFNSAASYSGPAAIRLLRSSCGQTPHADLYKPVPEECYIMDNLSKLGFVTQLMMDHDGTFGDFLKELREDGGLEKTPVMLKTGISPELVAFNGQLISDDGQLLTRWLQEQNGSRSATFFNVIALHDGNSYIGQSKPAPYQERAQKLFEQMDSFFSALDKSGRKAVVIFIAEHGANLAGDKLQMPGLRDIPSPSITHIPVGIKFTGLKAAPAGGQIHITTPSSYLAVSELLLRLVTGKLFDQPVVDLKKLTLNLPETAAVSANEGVTVMDYQGTSYILLKGDSNWVPYPK